MSKQRGKCEYVEGGSKGARGREKMHLNLHPAVDSKHKENVVKRLASLFQDTFDLELIQSVAQTCQWDCKYKHSVIIFVFIVCHALRTTIFICVWKVSTSFVRE